MIIKNMFLASRWLFFVILLTLSSGLPLLPDSASFIVSYINKSELQVPFYTVIVCGGQERRVLQALSESFKKLYLLRPSHQNIVSEWNITDDPQGFILDMDCDTASSILKQASDLTLFRRPYSWLLITSENTVDATLDTLNSTETVSSNLLGLEDKNVRLDSLVVIASPVSDEKFELKEAYRIIEKWPIIIKHMGEWTAQEGIQLESTDVIALRRRDLNGTLITGAIVITHEGNINHLEDLVNKHHDSASRLSYAVISAMANIFNARVKLIETNTWGALVNGSWNGMIGEIVNKRADIGCCPLFLTPDRMQYVEYLHGAANSKVAFIATAPPLSYSSNLFTLPFSSSVWAASVGLIIVTSILLYVTTKYENHVEGLKVLDKDTLGANWSDIAMLNLGAICQQGCDAEPKGPSGRTVTIILYLAVMFLYVSYSASIVALLQSSDTSIKTIKNLLDSPLQCGAENIPYQRIWFKAATDPVRRELYSRKIAPKGEESAHFLTIEEGIRKVRQGLYAFHVELSPGYQVVQQTFTETEKCGLQELPSFLQVPEPWVPMPKYSPFAEVFKIGMKMAREMGIEDRTKNRLYTIKPPCSAPGSNFVSVGLMDCYHLFLILTYGFVSSLVLVVIERLVQMRLRRRLAEVNNPKQQLTTKE